MSSRQSTRSRLSSIRIRRGMESDIRASSATMHEENQAER